MTIPPSEWKSKIIKIIDRISDEEYQRLTWLGDNSDEISSPDEMICYLFDDLMFKIFLTNCGAILTSKEKRVLRHFIDELDRFSKNTPQHLDPFETIIDPRWNKIRNMARIVVKTLINK